MNSKIKNDVIEQLLLPKKEKIINQLVNLITIDAKKLVKPDIELKVINFIYDRAFDFDYYVFVDNLIVDYKFHTSFSTNVDYRSDTDYEIMDSIIYNQLLKDKGSEPDYDSIHEFTEEWENDNVEIEYNFFSDCWIEAKRRTKSEMRALLYEHECWSKSFELDDKVFINQEDHFEYLKKKEISIKKFQ